MAVCVGDASGIRSLGHLPGEIPTQAKGGLEWATRLLLPSADC
jgi:hypothetical protein